jgi:hypothetical protein
MGPHTVSPTIFFGTILVVAIGAFIPLLFGRETVGQLEAVTERVARGHNRRPERPVETEVLSRIGLKGARSVGTGMGAI